ncbi:MAG TPA: pantoate--beta-alanine ligase [Salinivirgaceae bacterium]|nr:pantoate--beta-alanine ligase [Salinivirgaceae bacterium]
MEIFRDKNSLITHIKSIKDSGKTIGFVPTMGALHEGHLSLIRTAQQEIDVVVVSIFVNPTQFNNKEDLRLYPRKEASDLEKLQAIQCDVVFVPDEQEMYPEPDTREFDLGHFAHVMEGKFRPGHFNGVVQIVTKLFDVVQPHKAYFGQKDFQQLAIIQYITKKLGYSIEIVPVPTVRESDGLAMSSRNERLTPEQRAIAPLIYKTLQNAVLKQKSLSVSELELWVTEQINQLPFLRVEYFQVVNSETLLPINNWHEKCKIIGCIAVFCGDVRLIDNIFF